MKALRLPTTVRRVFPVGPGNTQTGIRVSPRRPPLSSLRFLILAQGLLLLAAPLPMTYEIVYYDTRTKRFVKPFSKIKAIFALFPCF